MLPESFAETGFFATPPGAEPPRRFQVIGERSSGTNFLTALLGMNTGLQRTDVLGWKHGFLQALAVPSDVLVVGVVRHPEAWALSMFAKPWHTEPALQRLPFAEFLRAEWRTVYDRHRYFGRLGPAFLGQPLQQDRDPLTGAAFADLFALRTAKLRHLLSFAARRCTFCLVRLETAQDDPQALLGNVRRRFDLLDSESEYRPVMRRKGSKFLAAVDSRPELPATMPDEDRAFMWSRLDRDLEARLGYAP